MKIIFYLFILSSLFSQQSHATVIKINNEAGLYDKCINGISKDNRGLMWIGTQSGLFAFDGYTFWQPSISNPVVKNPISKILYNKTDDMLWVASELGLYTIQCNTFIIRQVLTEGKWKGNAVMDIRLSEAGKVYAVFKKGELVEFSNPVVYKVISVLPVSESKNIFPVSITLYKNVVNVSLNKQSFQYSYEVKNHYRLFETHNTKDIPRIEANDSNIRLYAESFIKEFKNGKDARSITLAKELSGLNYISSFEFIDSNSFYIFVRPCKVYKVNIKEKAIEEIKSLLFTGCLVKSTMQDNFGITWVGTNKGLFKINQSSGSFKNYLVVQPSISVRSFLKDVNGNIYAGTYNGLYLKKSKSPDWNLISDRIPFHMVNGKGRFDYFVETQTQLYRIDHITGKTEKIVCKQFGNIESKSYRSNTLACVNNWILMGTNTGVLVYNTLNDSLTAAPFPEGLEVRNIQVLSNEKILVATNNGLYETNGQLMVTHHWNTSTYPALSSNIVNYTDVDTATGIVWICTEGGGINLLNQNKKKITIINKESGLSDNTAYNLLFVDNNVWISTYNGLSCYNKKRNFTHNFFAETDGISNNEFNRNAFLYDHRNHKIYFGSVDGFTEFNPDSLNINYPNNRLFIASVSKWSSKSKSNVYIYPDSTAEGNKISIGPSDHTIVIRLAQDNFSDPEKVIFRYRINGVTNSWNKLPQGQNDIQLYNLASGIYNIEISAIDNRGTLVRNKIALMLDVQAPFYKTIWFWVLIVLAVSGLIIFIYSNRIKNLKTMALVKQQIANDLHDELGSLLTRVTMNSDNLIYINHTEAEQKEKLHRIAYLSRYAASSISDILWSINAKNNDLGSLTDRVRECTEDLLNSFNPEKSIRIDVNPNQTIDSEKRKEIYLIYKEIVRNIKQHSYPTKISISFVYIKDSLLIEVTNNGVLNTDEAVIKQRGLYDIEKRAARIKAEMNFVKDGDTFSIVVKSVGRINKHKINFDE